MNKECLIIQYPYVIKPEAKAKKVEELARMKEKGIIILDPTARVLSVPKSVDILVEPHESEDKCKNCEYYRNPDYTRCHECKAES